MEQKRGPANRTTLLYNVTQPFSAAAQCGIRGFSCGNSAVKKRCLQSCEEDLDEEVRADALLSVVGDTHLNKHSKSSRHYNSALV